MIKHERKIKKHERKIKKLLTQGINHDIMVKLSLERRAESNANN